MKGPITAYIRYFLPDAPYSDLISDETFPVKSGIVYCE